MTLTDLSQTFLTRFEPKLKQLLQRKALPQRLHQAMEYTVCQGGKRIRPLLVYLTGQCFASQIEPLLLPACAVELIHCYSLVHDDLPAMDDDDLRRGQASCHIAFDEATAILVGDSLQALAFEIITEAEHYLGDQQKLAILKTLAHACGCNGMVSGQAIDIAATACQLNIEQLKHMHRLKTGALLRASVLLGAHAAGVKQQAILQQLAEFADHLGLAFQIQDDVLDVEKTSAELGKPSQSDLHNNKATFATLLPVTEAKNLAATTYDKALSSLAALPINVEPLQLMTQALSQRQA